MSASNENNELENSLHEKSSPSSSNEITLDNPSNHLATDDTNNDGGEPILERFIQLIDREKPSPSNDDTEDDNDYFLDASTEDPFTLESFDTLIQQHAEKGKDFILARVTTADSSDESKTYQSYYSAHHINKVLFRTQPDQGLLHRMKAKNPLNNMNIIGDVHYYAVKAESVRLTQQSFAKSSAMSISSRKTLHLNGDNIATTEISATSALDKSEGDTVIKVEEDVNEEDSSSGVDGPNSSSPSVKQVEQQISDGIALRRMSNSLGKERRWSSGDLVQQPPRIFIPEYSLHVRRHQSMNGLRPSSSVLNSRKFDTKTLLTRTMSDDKSTKLPLGDNGSIDTSTTATTVNATNSQIMTKHEKTTPPAPTYKAIFYATDDDFLMKSTVRQYFNTNTIDPLDSQLFSINMSTQTSSATGTLARQEFSNDGCNSTSTQEKSNDNARNYEYDDESRDERDHPGLKRRKYTQGYIFRGGKTFRQFYKENYENVNWNLLEEGLWLHRFYKLFAGMRWQEIIVLSYEDLEKLGVKRHAPRKILIQAFDNVKRALKEKERQ
ncbi:11265_t:CDS:2, partial [Acaulospora colombiana]